MTSTPEGDAGFRTTWGRPQSLLSAIPRVDFNPTWGLQSLMRAIPRVDFNLEWKCGCPKPWVEIRFYAYTLTVRL